MGINSEVTLDDDLFNCLAARTLSPLRRRERLYICGQGDRRELLEKAYEEERNFVVGELVKDGCQYEYYELPSRHTCCPRQILGPALKGTKMKGLGVRYLWRRSSRKRSGSNSRAGQKLRKQPSIQTERVSSGSPSGPHKSVRRCIRKTE
jgi:hypothetical protein